jgi:hypothetical protein
MLDLYVTYLIESSILDFQPWIPFLSMDCIRCQT